MTNGADHTVCAIVLWQAQTQAKMLEMECIALRQELERMRKEASKEAGNAIRAVPDSAETI